MTQWTGQFDQTNNHRLPNIEKDSFVHSENFGEEIHVAGVDSDTEVNQSSVVSDETTPDPLGVSQSKSTKQDCPLRFRYHVVTCFVNAIFGLAKQRLSNDFSAFL